MATAGKLFPAVGFRVDIDEVAHPDGRVVVFQVPARPQGTAYHLDGKYLMRAGESLVPMSADQLRRIFAEGRPDWLEEAARPKLSAQRVVELLDTQTFFELLGMPYPQTQERVLERLIAERLVDESDGAFTIRRIGALLLAKRLEEFSAVSRKAPRVVVYRGGSKLDTRLDQIGNKGYAVGFQGLVGFIAAQLPQAETIGRGLRREVQFVPEVVIRELTANALIHQDFEMSGASVMVEIYDDRLEISNPGEPVVPVERFIDGYQSRNERLAGLMRRLRICEEKSSGIDRVVSSVEQQSLPAPDFRTLHRRTVVVVYGPRAFDQMDRDDRIRAAYQHAALKWVTSQWMTNQSLRERFQLPENKSAIVSQAIAAAIEHGLIKLDERVGASRKFARYLPFWA